MKTKLLKLCTFAGLIIAQSNASMEAQTVSTIETLTLSPNSSWNGSSVPLGTTFNSGNAIFQNYYDTAYGGYWAGGWAYSNKQDSTTAGYANMYSATTAVGYGGSANYLIGKDGAKINLKPTAFGKVVSGFYITNSTYAALSMKNGDSFAKKFGDTTGTHSGLTQGTYPDWFKLTVRKWLNGVMTNDSVEFYLADFRFANSAQDYIVKTWEWVDLTSLGNVDSLKFELSSSDVGQWGMNTPAYFCIDNFTTSDIALAISEIDNNNLSISLFPNPTCNNININLENLIIEGAKLEIVDATGKLVYSEIIYTSSSQISVESLSTGIYYLKLTGNNFIGNTTFIKQ